MRVIYVLFDSLNRHVLGAYGGLAIFRRMTDRQFNIVVYILLIASWCC